MLFLSALGDYMTNTYIIFIQFRRRKSVCERNLEKKTKV